MIYPGGLSRTGFMVLGLLVLGVNLLIYGWVYYRGTNRAE